MHPNRFLVEPDTTRPDGAQKCAPAVVCPERPAAARISLRPFHPLWPGVLLSCLSVTFLPEQRNLCIPAEYQGPHQSP